MVESACLLLQSPCLVKSSVKPSCIGDRVCGFDAGGYDEPVGDDDDDDRPPPTLARSASDSFSAAPVLTFRFFWNVAMKHRHTLLFSLT